MSQKFKEFKRLHQSDALFVLPNVWNAKSAVLFQEQGFPAIATSSMAVADSIGYEDGEGMPFNDYLFIIKRILASVKIPLSVDMEMGFGIGDEQILSNIEKLTELGVAGINIEDSSIVKSARVLKDPGTFAKTIEKVKNKLAAKGTNLFINIRCDTYILNVKNKEQETLNRLKQYETTGADGIFLPCISDEKDISEVVSNTKLPLNVMCVPGLPDFDKLVKLGVKRISMGPFLFNKVYSNIAELTKTITKDNRFTAILQ
jgi:2-methylisocitrate lyase-like PEP mutase family enzyme